MKEKAIGENHLYSKAYAKGKKCVTKNAVVYVLKDYKASKFEKENPKKEKINRVGITVSKKLGGAVERNRVKRIFREAYRQLKKEEKIKCGFLLVFVARGATLGAKTQDLYKDLKFALYNLSMIEEKKKEPCIQKVEN